MTNCSFSSNEGGGIFLGYSFNDFSLTGNNYFENVTGSINGSIFLFMNDNNIFINNCIFNNINSSNTGGILVVQNSNNININSIKINNSSALIGAAFYFYDWNNI